MKIKCKICGRELKLINNAHLREHGITRKQYRELYPNAILCSDEHKGKHRPDMVGDKNPAKRPEVKRKISDALNGREFTEDWRKKLSQHKKTKEHRENLSKAKIGIPMNFSEEELKRRRELIRGENNPMKNPITKEINRKRQSITHKQLWQDPEFVKKMFAAWNIKPNKPEKILNDILQHILPDEYTLNVEGHIVIDGKVPDFVNINGQKKLIEFNGCFFHHCPICFPDSGVNGLKKVEDRIKLFKKYGYDTLVIWEHEMENIDAVTNKILKFNNTSHHK